MTCIYTWILFYMYYRDGAYDISWSLYDNFTH